jgi:hypothetical protein
MSYQPGAGTNRMAAATTSLGLHGCGIHAV